MEAFRLGATNMGSYSDAVMYHTSCLFGTIVLAIMNDSKFFWASDFEFRRSESEIVRIILKLSFSHIENRCQSVATKTILTLFLQKTVPEHPLARGEKRGRFLRDFEELTPELLIEFCSMVQCKK